MRGVFLHVLGDALGNIGVIATALFIWLTDFTWRFYADPVISLVITAIIFSSALPLVKSASFILLQGVPTGVSLDDVKEDILEVLISNLSFLLMPLIVVVTMTILTPVFRLRESRTSTIYTSGNFQT